VRPSVTCNASLQLDHKVIAGKAIHVVHKGSRLQICISHLYGRTTLSHSAVHRCLSALPLNVMHTENTRNLLTSRLQTLRSASDSHLADNSDLADNSAPAERIKMARKYVAYI